VVVNFEGLELIATIAVALVMGLGAWLAKRIPHGEARFDKNGKLIEDE